MNCGASRKQLDAWLDDELSVEARNAVQAHLADCPDCADWFAKNRAIAIDLSALDIAADRISASPVVATPKRSLHTAWRVAAMVAVAAVTFMGFRSLMQPERTTIYVAELNPHATRASGDATRVVPDDFSIEVDESYLPVSIKSGNPNIRIVWLYGDGPAADESAPATDNSDVSQEIE